VLVYLAVVRGFNPAEMFGLRQMSVKRAFLFAILGLVLTFLGMVLGTAALVEWNGGKLPDSSAQETVEAFEKSGSLAFRLMLGLMAVIIAPLTEELLFRGFLYGVIKSSTDRWFSAVFTALIFAIVHFHVGSAPQLFMLGLGLAVAYEQTGSLLVPVFMHAIFNGWNVAMLAYTVFTK
jgi:membrane protease YdiL (CAAX protease family)